MKEVDEAQVKEVNNKKALLPDEKFLEMTQNVEEIQKQAKNVLVNNILKEFSNEKSPFAMALRAYRDEIYQYAEKENKPEVVALYEKVDKFIYRCVGLVDKKREKKDFTQEDADILFGGENGLRDTMLAIKRFKKNNAYPLELVSKSDEMIEGLSNMMKRCFFQVASNYEFTNSNVMIAANSGDFNIAEGEELLEGISVVSAIYQLTKKDGLDKIDNKGYYMGLDLIESPAEKVLKKKAFKSYFQVDEEPKKDDAKKDDAKKAKKFDIYKIEQTVKNHNEWEAIESATQIEREERAKKKQEEERKRQEEEAARKAQEEEAAKNKENDVVNINAVDEPNAGEIKEEKKEEKKSLIDEFEVVSKDKITAEDTDTLEDFFQRYAPAKPKYKSNQKRGISEREILANERAKERTIRDNASDAYKPEGKLEYNPQEKAVLAGYALVSVFDRINNDLKGLKKNLLNVIDAKNADGMDDYKAVIAAIDQVNKDIDRKADATTLEVAANDVSAAFNLINKYVKKHAPKVRGHRSEQTKEVYELMKQFGPKTVEYKNSINTLSAEANKALIEGEKDWIKQQEDSIEEAKYRGETTFTFPQYTAKRVGNGNKLKNLSFADISSKLYSDYEISDNTEFLGGAKAIVEDSILTSQKKYYIDRIYKYFKDTEPLYDVEGFYNSMEETDTYNSLTSGDDEKPLIDPKYASLADLAKTGVMMRELRKLKTRSTTLSELKALDEKLSQGGFEKEYTQLYESEGFRVDMESASKSGIKDKHVLAERFAYGLERNRKKAAAIFNEFENLSVDELKEQYMHGYKEINSNLVYNIACSAALGKPENSKVLYQYVALNNTYYGENNSIAASKRIKAEAFKYFDKIGILGDLRDKNKTRLENVPELVEKIKDPEVLKGFVKVIDKATKKELEIAKPYIYKNAEDFGFRYRDPKGYRRAKQRESDKIWKKLRKNIERNEELEIAIGEKKKAKLERMEQLIKNWSFLEPVPKELVEMCPFKEPAYAEYYRDKFKSNRGFQLGDEDYDLKPVSRVELENTRKTMKKSVALQMRKTVLLDFEKKLQNWNVAEYEAPSEMLVRLCPGMEEAKAEVYRDRYEKNGRDINKLVDENGYLLPVSKKEIKEAEKVLEQRKEMREELQAQKAQDNNVLQEVQPKAPGK